MRWVESLRERGGRRAMQTPHEVSTGELPVQSANLAKRQ